MADAKFEEAIRLAFETSGTEGIKKAASIIASMGDVSEETRAQAAAMLDSIGNVEKTSAAAAQYQKIGAGIVDYQHQITEATAKVQAMSAAVKEAEAPTKAQQRDLANARKTLSDLNAAQDGELAKLRALKTQLDANGISTKSAAASQRDLAAQTATASANLQQMVRELQQTRDADAAMQAEVAAGNAKSKKEVHQYVEALKQVETQLHANKEAAVSGSEAAAASMEHTRGVLGMLKYMLVSIAAYTGAQGIYSGIKSILSTGDQFQKYQLQLEAIYGTAAKGKDAFAWVKQFAKTTPLQMSDVMQAFIQLKNFGIDPMDGSLRSAIDQNAKLGGESERLMRITLAMGQAFSKGALEGQDIKQMIEAGVPVWQLLTEVTGKSTGELMKMSAAGQIGTDVMRKFFAQMGKDSAGASVKQMQLLSGQFSNLKDNIQQFEDRVSRKGVLDYLRDQLAALNAKFIEMRKNGQLDYYAKRVSDALVSLAKSIKSATTFVIDHTTAIKRLALAYGAFKTFKIGSEIAAAGIRMVKFTKAVRAGTLVIKELPVALRVARVALLALMSPVGLIVAGLAAFAAVVKLVADAWVDYAEKHSAAAKKLAAENERIREDMRKLSEEWGRRADALKKYSDTQLLTAEGVAELTEKQREQYAADLANHAEYLRDKWKQQQTAVLADKKATNEMRSAAEKARKAFMEAASAVSEIKKGIELANQPSFGRLIWNAYEASKAIVKLGNDSVQLKNHIDGLFTDMGKQSQEQLGEVALVMGRLGTVVGRTGHEIRKNISGALTKLSSEDLLQFQTVAQQTFKQVSTNAARSSYVLTATMEEALTRLGVSTTQWGVKTTQAGQDNIHTFQTVATNAQASAGAIEAAFNAALAHATTADDAKAIGDALADAGKRGAVGFDATSRAVKAVKDRVAELQDTLDPLNASFAGLGIESQRMLDAAAQKAHDLFDNIVQGARRGEASVGDVRRAFQAYARAQLDAVADADDWKKEQVKSALAVQASINGVTTGLGDMGDAGTKAGNAVAAGAQHAAAALDDTATAASGAAQQVDQTSQSLQKGAESAGKSAEDYQKQFRPAAVALNGFSDALLRAYAAQNQFAGNVDRWADKMNAITAEWRRQKDAYEAQLESLNHQNAAYDKAAQRVEALRKEYSYLTDEQLRNLDAARQALEENEKRAKQATLDALKKNDAANAAQTEKWEKEAAAKSGTQMAAHGGAVRHEIHLQVSASQTPGAAPAQLNNSDVQKVANEIVRQIGIKRLSANR